MGFLRFCRRAFMLFRVEHTREELLLMYGLVKRFGAFFDGYEVARLAQPPPAPVPAAQDRPVLPPTLF
jgi:hypothetical protein